MADLEGKTVEFQIPTRGGILAGVAAFSIRRNPEGELAIDIVTKAHGRDLAERIKTWYHLPQVAVDRIERHPDSSVADFRLL